MSACNGISYRMTLLNVFAEHVLNNPNIPDEFQFLLHIVASKIPQSHLLLAWYDSEINHGSTLNLDQHFHSDAVAEVQNWIVQKLQQMGTMNPMNELEDLVAKAFGDGKTVRTIQAEFIFGRLFACILIDFGDSTPKIAGPVMQDIENALSMCLVLHHFRSIDNALTDPLTLLPNRMSFFPEMQSAIQDLREHEQTFAIAVINLDRFLRVNDSLGERFADEVLKCISQRLVHFVSASNFVARLGGDEFGVLIRGTSASEDLYQMGEELAAQIRQPIIIAGHSVRITASIGIANWNDCGDNPHHLIRNAYTAARQAKKRGRNGAFVHDSHRIIPKTTAIDLEDELALALERDEFVLHYQPRVSAQSDRIVGAEALIRWEHPTKGLLPPKDFIPVAEESTLIIDIGDWVLRRALQQVQDWLGHYPNIPRVAINISPQQLMRGGFVGMLLKYLDETSINPTLLEIEVTETAVIDYGDDIISTVKRIRDAGVRISIDDFGTGYSSLEILKRFTADYLKIDQSFVKDLDFKSRAIVSTVTQLAHSIDLQVVGEGVETHSQREFLLEVGCDELQGFLFGRPLPPEKFVRYLK
ncbi:bifunctional diguanylate cyclase/phosphodiesterase [Alicyclobacillus tolerans]|uniref:putative bifunctional diguanylate cyclase/phosphodiesterase n=1 Tax=Alicyclobacillus tolerans TaxID=90970 RepID=UPI001F31667B|nr:bifunctional diguanylate cyclase/phosphodiesterase [Alicyclobacillus tolerans]MCF8568108.1 bifunctional diguanylate cyclase/phosphodiesterase [Alicyclobacillus tolerans]